jgi:hypothetical protein
MTVTIILKDLVTGPFKTQWLLHVPPLQVFEISAFSLRACRVVGFYLQSRQCVFCEAGNEFIYIVACRRVARQRP